MSTVTLDQIHHFLDWAGKKIGIHFAERGEVNFHEREIWWASLGENIGSEANGKNSRYERPIVIFKKFSKDMLLAVPCTTKIKDGSWYHRFVLNGCERRAVMAQVRTMSSKRLIRYMDRLAVSDFIALQTALLKLIKTDPSTDVEGSSGFSCENNVNKE